MPNPEVRYCTTEDGVQIAYCVEGEGLPVLLIPFFLDSFSLDHLVPEIPDALRIIAEDCCLIRFDTRGTGLSQRDVPDMSAPALQLDVDAVVQTLGLRRFSLVASAIGTLRALDYTIAHPERIDRLVLYAAFARVFDAYSEDFVRGFVSLARSNWPLAARTFADNRDEFGLRFAEVVRQSTTGETVANFVERNQEVDLTARLTDVNAPTLLIYAMGDTVYPIKLGEKLTAAIPDVRLVNLPNGASVGVADKEAAHKANAFLRAGRKSGSMSLGEPAGPLVTAIAPAVTPQSFSSGRYVVSKLLGEGGQKIVFLARDTQLDRDVAIALLKPEGIDGASLARLKREAQALAHLEAQPHIVAIYDIGEHESRRFTVCEYLAGGNLEEELARAGGPLPVERAVAIAQDVCRALIVAHDSDIIHRDIKPSNIWLTASGNAKLGDFGLASALGRSHLTQAGTIMGTAAYMAPEQALGHEADQRSDLYSLGCVLYEMLTGRPPFLGDTAVAVVAQHINASPVAPSDLQPGLPPGLEGIVLQMLAKAPEDRPQTAADVLAALEGNASLAVASARVRTSSVVTEPQIQYCTASDGVRIAYYVMGAGMPFVAASELQWSNLSDTRGFREYHRSRSGGGIGRGLRVIRYDARGTGLSDRLPVDFSWEAQLRDLEAVLAATAVERFALFGHNHGATTAVSFAARFPDRVSHLILASPYRRGVEFRPMAEILGLRPIDAMSDEQWVAYTRALADLTVGYSSPNLAEAIARANRASMSIDAYRAFMQWRETVDLTKSLETISVPTLVLYRRHTKRPALEPDVAARIPGARLFTLDANEAIPERWHDAETEAVEEFLGIDAPP